MMMQRKGVPIGIVVFIIMVIVLDVVYFFSLIFQGTSGTGSPSEFLTVSIPSFMMWMDILLVTLSLVIIPYGFMKRKNWARRYAFVFLLWSLFRSLVYISMTGEKLIGLLLFALFVVSMMYLLMSPVKRYFGKISVAIVPAEIIKGYTCGIYTLYSRLVRLKNGNNQIIYFFSKRKPKSGTPAVLPDGFEVEVSSRSGLPYLKKRHECSNIF